MILDPDPDQSEILTDSYQPTHHTHAVAHAGLTAILPGKPGLVSSPVTLPLPTSHRPCPFQTGEG